MFDAIILCELCLHPRSQERRQRTTHMHFQPLIAIAKFKILLSIFWQLQLDTRNKENKGCCIKDAIRIKAPSWCISFSCNKETSRIKEGQSKEEGHNEEGCNCNHEDVPTVWRWFG